MDKLVRTVGRDGIATLPGTNSGRYGQILQFEQMNSAAFSSGLQWNKPLHFGLLETDLEVGWTEAELGIFRLDSFPEMPVQACGAWSCVSK